MCGIAGIVDTRFKREPDRGLALRMNDAIAHRGPDGDGLHLEPGVALCHRRLAIIDLATGQQPLYNEDGSVVVVYNGEIYNYQQLIPELQALGHSFHTRSDTEVIVHAWEAWGERCVERFRGMFAFALWDRNRETLFMARDRLGVKPLHYALLPDGQLLFASEIKALLKHPGLDRAIDPLAVEEYFAFGYVAEPRSIYRSVRKLPPAHTLVIRRGEPVGEPRRYWDVRFTADSSISLEDAVGELNRRLEDSVRLRLISEVPLGAFLSGGVDSSAVVATMARVSPERANTCSISFDDPAYDETRFAEMVATRYATRHRVDHVASDDFDLVDELARVYDEPYADSSAIPTYRVCQLARRHVTVALSGDGGDESFAGYRRYRLHLAEERLRSSSAARGATPCVRPARAPVPEGGLGAACAAGQDDVRGAGAGLLEGYAQTMGFVREPLRRQLFSARFQASLGGYRAAEVFARHAARADTDDPLALVQYLDLQTYLVGDINTKVDRASMAHSLEVREPLMDHPLVEWLATLPTSLKLRGGEGKYLLKKAMEPHLPREILYRPKMGFAVPLARWLRGPLRERLRGAVQGETLAATGMFDAGTLRHLVDAHLSGRRDYSTPLWTLLMFDAFLRNESGETVVRPLRQATG